MPAAAGARRGKKKDTPAEEKNEVVQTELPIATASVEEVAEPTPTKRKGGSKKPVKVIAVVTPNGIEGSFTPEPRRPLIAHLQIKTNEVVFHDQALRYDPNPPTLADPAPYDATETNFFTAGQEQLGEFILRGEERAPKVAVAAATAVAATEVAPAPAAAPAPAGPKSFPCFTKSDLMIQFRDDSNRKCLPPSSDIACFWCAHSFEGMPCIIPEREVGGVYNVYGNFCCSHCAVAYLLCESLDPHVRWERMALLHRIYDVEGKGRIFPAPARESLKLFGGPMDIDTFRATAQEGRVRVDLHMPPMVSILGSIDTKPIDFFDTNSKQGAVGGAPIGGPMPQRVPEGELRLKRTKPLKDRESTLDNVMNIRVGAGRRGTGLTALGAAAAT
jgi:hypothetical protein